MTEITDILSPGAVRVHLPGHSKEQVVNALIDLLKGHPNVRDLEGVRAAVFEREAVMSTGVGKGLGLPHAKTAAVTDTVAAFAVTEEAIDFGSIDNKPVRLLFLLVGSEHAKSQHIKLLSRVSRLMNRDTFRDRLMKTTHVSEVLAIFHEGELQLAEH